MPRALCDIVCCASLYEPKCTWIAHTKIFQQTQWNIAKYIVRGSPYTRRSCKIRVPTHEINELNSG